MPISFLTESERQNPIPFPVNVGDEKLLWQWTLSPEDKREIGRCRGINHQLSFALQLCVLRNYGRFLQDYSTVPIHILNHLGGQLGQPPVLFLEPPHREATDLEHERRIREHLSFRSFDEAVQDKLESWLYRPAMEGFEPRDLYHQAEDLLRSWKVVLPAPSSLERIVGSVGAHAGEVLFDQITKRLTPELQHGIDTILEVPKGDHRSKLFRLKQYPPEAKATAIKEYIERYHLVSALGVEHLDLNGISLEIIDSLSALAQRYDVTALKRFPATKRYAMVACFLVDAQKTILDHIVAMHDQLLTAKFRQSNNVFEKRYRQIRRQYKKGLGVLIATGKALLDPDRPREAPLAELLRDLDEKALQEAITVCDELRQLEMHGYLDELRARYPGLRRYLPAFFKLPFQGEPGSESLLVALDLIRKLDAGQGKELPWNAPTQFVPQAFRSTLVHKDGTFDRRTWELALAISVRDALRSGDLYLPESRRHVSFWNLIYDEQRWAQQREQAFSELDLPHEAERFVIPLRQAFDDTVRCLERGLKENRFVEIHNGRIQTKRDPASDVPPDAKELQSAIETHLPHIRIEDLLIEVDSWCHFTKEFKPLGSYRTKIKNFYATLLATLIAHGTNLGIAVMGNSAVGISEDSLQHVSQWFLREETLKAANAVLINYHHSFELTSLWGQGHSSSSDGQRFGIRASSLLGSFYPRYFGYYDRAVSVYTHTSNQYSVFSTKVISCSEREALYVLDGLLENNTVLRPKEHYTDTHGYTEQLFGLCYLLGYLFMPRIKDLKDQQLYKLDRTTQYGCLDQVFRASVDLNLIREQWDQLIRVAASLRNQTAPAHVVLKRLASGSPSDRLAKALTALGRIIKTIHILRYVHEEGLRRRIHLQLYRSEFRHKLARWLFFADQGAFRTGDYEEIMNKASCLSLLSNAVLVWNTAQISKIVAELQLTGASPDDKNLALISPLAHAHILPNGTYFFDKALSQESGE